MLKGEEEREEGWNLDLRIALPDVEVDAVDAGGWLLGGGSSSPRRLQKARSMLPRHCCSISIMVPRSYLPPRPSWIAEIFQGVATSTTGVALLVLGWSLSWVISGMPV